MPLCCRSSPPPPRVCFHQGQAFSAAPRHDMLTDCAMPPVSYRIGHDWSFLGGKLATAQVHPVPILRSNVLQLHLYAVLEWCLGTKKTLPSAALSQHGLPSLPTKVRALSLPWLHDHTEFPTPHSVANPLDEWSARSRDRYLTTHNTHKRKVAMPPAEFVPAIPASEEAKRATRIGHSLTQVQLFHYENISFDITYDIVAQRVLGFKTKTSISNTPN
jgi:hypothetical protein